MSAFNPLTDDGATRKVQKMNKHGTLGVCLGKEIQEKLGITEDDSVGIEFDEENNEITVHVGGSSE